MISTSLEEAPSMPPDDVTILAFITWSSPLTICSMFLSWPWSESASSQLPVRDDGPGEAVGAEGEATSAGGESVVSGAGGGVAACGPAEFGGRSTGLDRPLVGRRRSPPEYGAKRDDDETRWCRWRADGLTGDDAADVAGSVAGWSATAADWPSAAAAAR